MDPVDIAVTVIVCLAVAGVIGWFIYRKIKHKSISCDCSSCDGCCCCGKKKDEEKK